MFGNLAERLSSRGAFSVPSKDLSSLRRSGLAPIISGSASSELATELRSEVEV